MKESCNCVIKSIPHQDKIDSKVDIKMIIIINKCNNSTCKWWTICGCINKCFGNSLCMDNRCLCMHNNNKFHSNKISNRSKSNHRKQLKSKCQTQLIWILICKTFSSHNSLNRYNNFRVNDTLIFDFILHFFYYYIYGLIYI